MKAFLALEDGTIFEGKYFGAQGEIIGEVVFNTGMTGYQELLTDPSYFGQIVTMTYPLIGNYGINKDDFESKKPYVRGFIVREYCKENYSNWRVNESLDEYLKKNNIIGLEGIDTRKLTKILREKGTMKGIISTNPSFKFEQSKDKIDAFLLRNPVKEVTVKKPVTFGEDGFKVALYDFGAKRNIINSLQKRGCSVTVVPSNYKAEQILAENYDGIMLSNGPGDPKDEKNVIEEIKKLIQSDIPIFGICLGHQLLGLASGADTQKLKYGHRGCNHPVKDIEKDRTYITSQNHGYAVIADSVDKSRVVISHTNMNDNTVEGMKFIDKLIFSVQFHPEASPGPQETAYLFDQFIDNMKKRGDTKHA